MWNFIGRWHIWGILWNVSVFLVKIEAKIGVSVSGKRRFLHSYPIWSNKKGLLIKNLAQLFKCTVFKHKIWHVAKVQKKTAGSLFSEDISANMGIVMLQEWLNDGPWSSWYLTRTFSTSFVSNYSQPNWTGEGGCPREWPHIVVWRHPNVLIYSTLLSWNGGRLPEQSYGNLGGTQH